MDKKVLVKCVGTAMGVTLAMFLFRLVMADLTDVTTIDLRIFNFGWILEHIKLLFFIVLVGLVWLGLSMLVTQYSSDLSGKRQTASITMIVFGLAGSFSGILFFIGFRLIRAEHIPPIGFSNFWRIVLVNTSMSILGIYFNLQMLMTVKEKINPINTAIKEGISHVGFNGVWIPMGFFAFLISIGVAMIYPLFINSISFRTILNKEVILAIFFTIIAQSAQIGFTLVKARISDSTRISPLNFLRARWLNANIRLLIAVVLIAGLYLLGFLLSTQYSSNASSGLQTATMTSVIYGMIGGIFGFVQFLIFKVARSEKLPPLGFNRFWMSLVCITTMTLVSTLLNIGLLNEMARLR